jgi:hypothetical protein
MTDDFQLFARPDDGEGPVDEDLAIITAYLARELSPMQVLAVEERLITDADFRAAVQPLIDAWSAPVPSLAAAAGARAPLLSDREKSDAWQRFQLEEAQLASNALIPNRRISMKRVAAVVGITVLPMVTFAQAVVYSANNAGAPGHEVARRIVAAFSTQPAVETPPARVVVPIADVPLTRQLPAPSALPPRQPARAAAPLVPTIVMTGPDRAKVAAMVKEHQPAVARGDTAVSYVMMVLDASGRYVWSTYGNGIWGIDVAGDPRSPAERRQYQREHRAQFVGADGGASVVGGVVGRRVPDSIATRPYAIARIDTTNGTVRVMAGQGSRTMTSDTAVLTRVRNSIDSVGVVAGRVEARGGTAVARGGFVGALTRDSIRPSNEPGPYRAGFGSINGMQFNAASGLQEPGRGESGIQGLLAKNVSSVDTYAFNAGSLAPRDVQVVVVMLTSGASWSGR